MFRSFVRPRLAAVLLLVPACACLSVLSLPGNAQGKKPNKTEEAGSYVYMEGKVGEGVSDDLFIRGNITGGLGGNSEYSSRPTHFWIKNWGAKSCFISGEQAH